MHFPSQFFIYNYTKVLVSQSSFKTITFCFYCKGFCAYTFICDQHIFVSEILSESFFAVSQSIALLFHN